MNIHYTKIDKDLPDLTFDEKNSGIDLYSRVDMEIPPSIRFVQLQIGHVNAPRVNKDGIVMAGKVPVISVIGAITKFFKENFMAKKGPVIIGEPKEDEEFDLGYRDIPLNIILKGNKKRHSLLFPRSSLFAKYGLMLANNVGIIDPSYDGENDEVTARVLNLSPMPVLIPKGIRLCQIVFFDKPEMELILNKEHWGTDTRGGFGSTGEKA